MANINNETLAQLLDASSRRRKVLTNNLANLNTPGYRTARVNFKSTLEETLSEGAGEEPIETETVHPDFGDVDATGNNVRLGREIVKLNKNSLQTRCYLAYLKFRKRQTLSAIRGR